LKVRRKSRSTLPVVRAISIDLLGPNAKKAMTIITTISGIPMPKKFTLGVSRQRGNQFCSWLGSA